MLDLFKEILELIVLAACNVNYCFTCNMVLEDRKIVFFYLLRN